MTGMPPALAARSVWTPGPAVRSLGRAAVAALHDELVLEPKPGLVSPLDNGSHTDMDAFTFMRSLFALRHPFQRLAALGAAGVPFVDLEREGVAAEARMLSATAGINTHRGAIFTLGLLCASAGWLRARGEPLDPSGLRRTLLNQWGDALAARSRQPPAGSASGDAWRAGLQGAGAEASRGFPVLFEGALPALQRALADGLSPQHARVQALFQAMATLDDTNLARRGGIAGLRDAQAAARQWLRQGGAARPDGLDRARALHRHFVARRLSPGGAADVLAAACWMHRVCGRTP
jgi:triphosphoribosyl-dephospho-CoA synthase